MNARLRNVAAAKEAYNKTKNTLELELRERMKKELSNQQTQIDIAVRLAYDDGESKAAIGRALGTKDYHTVNASLKRTEGVAETQAEHELDHIYSLLDDQTLGVLYFNHGPDGYTGKAKFNITEKEGTVFFWAIESVWNDDYTVRNDAVVALDGKQDGYYYEEAVEWLKSKH